MRMILTPRANAITITITITITNMIMEEILMIRVKTITEAMGIARRVGDPLIAGLFWY